MINPEPKIVIEHREHLWWLLSEALQLEHMIMCQYLFAQFSLKDGARDGLTAEQADAVDRWRTKDARDRHRGDVAHGARRKPDVRDRSGPQFRTSELPAAIGLLPGRGTTRPVTVQRTGPRSLLVP